MEVSVYFIREMNQLDQHDAVCLRAMKARAFEMQEADEDLYHIFSDQLKELDCYEFRNVGGLSRYSKASRAGLVYRAYT